MVRDEFGGHHRDDGWDLTVGIAAHDPERAAVFALRMRVFVDEQAVPPEEELDVYDVTATHVYLQLAPELLITEVPEGIVAVARLVDKGGGLGKIGRVAVLEEYRGKGYGREIMRYVEEIASHRGFEQAILEAQVQAIPFYEKLGYSAEGDVFLDCGIEHRLMRRTL